MSPTPPTWNVFYLTPPSPAAQRPRRPLRSPSLYHRLLALGWRLRLTLEEVASAVRRFGRARVETDVAFLEQQADLILARSRPSAGPARVIDLAAARTRLRA
jgi:hypothetical protein